ncbi:MAG TPA: glyoxalase superfamily protein [Croceibacterium sp.]
MTTLTIDDAKAMARRLRGAMETRGLAASHSDALELVAAQLGHRDWNTASAALDASEPAGPRFTESIPVLRSLDERKCRAFYCGFLGFAIDFEHRFAPHMPLYLGLVRGPVKLHLSEHRGDAVTGTALFVWMAGIDDYRRELAASGAGFAVPEIADQPWGREIGLVDPFGNRLRFCERPPG